MQAIDLYSGVGGWSLGLHMAGIEVVASYELSPAANLTNHSNNGHRTNQVDIRQLPLDSLPAGIGLVVGSPPCTQFSYSNRGGGGDIADGLRDIEKFLSVVDQLKPRFWVMENVPRVANILRKELRPTGKLKRFRHLQPEIHILNMEDFGLPQRRMRCLAGNIPFDLLLSYIDSQPVRTLGDVVTGLSEPDVIDPVFGLPLVQASLSEHDKEEILNYEEERINRASKTLHPIYNAMAFPDRQDRTSRTITATCTRVSRESIVIEDQQAGGARRLTVRERASVQGFPIGYQFYGRSYAEKLRMIGNAVPPLFSLFVGHACLGRLQKDLPDLATSVRRFQPPSKPADATPPEVPGRRFPSDRTFRFAIPALRLKSGVRFELLNSFEHGGPGWEVAFLYGHSKAIERILPLAEVGSRFAPLAKQPAVGTLLSSLASAVRASDVKRMQDVWSHRGPGATRPLDFLDMLDDAARALIAAIEASGAGVTQGALKHFLIAEYAEAWDRKPGINKLMRHSPTVIAGLLLAGTVNGALGLTEAADRPAPASLAR